MYCQPSPPFFAAIGRLFMFAILCFNFSPAFAQHALQRLSQVDAAYLMGVSGDGYFFELDHGFEASLAHGANWGDFSLLGGAGYARFQRSGLVPVFMEASTLLGRKGRSHFGLRGGYSFAHRLGRTKLEEYRLKGGWFVSPGYGLTLFENKIGKLTARLGYRYQHSVLEFQPFDGGSKIRSPQHYHFIFSKLAWTLFHQHKTNTDKL